MTAPRVLLQQFALANPLYINATITAFTVSGGAKTTTKATLYADETTSATLTNPQKLDSSGKLSQAAYIDVPVVVTIEGFGNVPEHDTGIIAGNILLASVYAAAASLSAISAASSAATATTQAGISVTQTSLCTGYASAASASAATAASAAAGLSSTSTTSLAVSISSKSFTTQSGKQYAAGQFIVATSDADPLNYMHGQVTSYSGTSLVMDSQDVGGSGTHTDWTISVSGTRGQGGSATAGGTNGQIQYNNSGSLGGITVTGSGDAVLATDPTLTNPVVGTQSPGNNTTLAASTAFTTAAVAAGVAGLASTGYVASAIATQAATDAGIYAPKISPTFTGTVTIPNQTVGDNSTKAANTKFVADTVAALTLVGVLDRQNFTSSGTWTKPSGGGANAMALIECWGGGASGGGSGGGGGLGYGGGGGGGGYTYRMMPLASIGATETVTIGAGGVLSGTATGTTGGTTSFGSWMSAPGGSGGGWAATAGTASGGGGGSYDFPGGGGGSTTGASGNNGAFSNHGGGGGAGGFSGSGGTSICAGNGGAAHTNGSAPGGGGGGYSAGTGTSGNGAAGQVTVTVFA